MLACKVRLFLINTYMAPLAPSITSTDRICPAHRVEKGVSLKTRKNDNCYSPKLQQSLRFSGSWLSIKEINNSMNTTLCKRMFLQLSNLHLYITHSENGRIESIRSQSEVSHMRSRGEWGSNAQLNKSFFSPWIQIKRFVLYDKTQNSLQ